MEVLLTRPPPSARLPWMFLVALPRPHKPSPSSSLPKSPEPSPVWLLSEKGGSSCESLGLCFWGRVAEKITSRCWPVGCGGAGRCLPAPGFNECLSPGTSYKFRVRALNMLGESEPSAPSRPYVVSGYSGRIYERPVAGPYITFTDAVNETTIMLKWMVSGLAQTATGKTGCASAGQRQARTTFLPPLKCSSVWVPRN